MLYVHKCTPFKCASIVLRRYKHKNVPVFSLFAHCQSSKLSIDTWRGKRGYYVHVTPGTLNRARFNSPCCRRSPHSSSLIKLQFAIRSSTTGLKVWKLSAVTSVILHWRCVCTNRSNYHRSCLNRRMLISSATTTRGSHFYLTRVGTMNIV